MNIQSVKQRFGIIGNYDGLNRAIDVAMQVAPTDLSVLITGESGTGKEVFPQIIHQMSARKHGSYIAVNCGAIPEGTIDSELFGHEKGSFTGAHEARKGYFEVADGGTIFLDEVSELPLSTQVRLLRVLETGEFIRVGSSKALKTDVRVVAATNLDVTEAVRKGKFREDLFYRLNSVPIFIPPLRDRGDDIYLLFRKFANDFAERYRMPSVRLTDDGKNILTSYYWPGNVRQLKNVTEQLSVIEEKREIDGECLKQYLPDYMSMKLPALLEGQERGNDHFSSEREILYKVLFDMKNDMNDLKRLVLEIMKKEGNVPEVRENNARIIQKLTDSVSPEDKIRDQYPNGYKHSGQYRDDAYPEMYPANEEDHQHTPHIQDTEEIIEESLLLESKEIELIKKALNKHEGKRKQAAEDLGISERTLYRKIKEYGIK